MMRMNFGLLLAALCALPAAHADYRVHELRVRNTETGTEQTVLSTLDHLQYPAYYPLARNEIVKYVTSWRCRGRTGGFRRPCPNPQSAVPPAPST